MTARVIVTVSAEGVVSARTDGIIGERCLDYIEVLESLLDAQTVESSFTAEYSQAPAQTLPNRIENAAHVDPA